LVLLGELFDDLVDELAKGLGLLFAVLATLVKNFQELSQILFAVLICVRQIDQT
jgi:hypothetical protein